MPRWRSVDYVAQVAGFVAQVAGFVAQVAGFVAQVAGFVAWLAAGRKRHEVWGRKKGLFSCGRWGWGCVWLTVLQERTRGGVCGVF